MRVLTICDKNGVSEYYRTLLPYRLLAEAGEIELTASNGRNPTILNELDTFDTVVFSRPDSAEYLLILCEARRLGKRVIVDLDDNLFLVPPSIGPYEAWHQRGQGKITGRLYYLKKAIEWADCLTVSTECLGRQLTCGEPHSFRGTGDYRLLPNMILAADWDVPPAEKSAGEIWVGWWGIYNHWDDWRDVARFIEPVILERPNVKLILLGMPELAHLFPRLRQGDQLHLGPFVPADDLTEYRQIIRALDVALAPTADYPFNYSKSDLKLLQYGAAGVATVASAVTYREWSDEALVIEQPDWWGTALRLLLDDGVVRRQYAERLHERVMNERTYEHRFDLWRGVLYETEVTPV